MLKDYLAVGQVLRPQGVRGEVKVKPLTDDPRRFLVLERVYLLNGESYAPLGMRCTRVHEGFAYVLFDGVADREAADAHRGALLYVDRGHAAPLAPDADYIVDLIGCEVFGTQGGRIGALKEVLQPGANDVYVLDTPAGELLIPALKRVVLAVDVAARRITVDESVLPEVGVLNMPSSLRNRAGKIP